MQPRQQLRNGLGGTLRLRIVKTSVHESEDPVSRLGWGMPALGAKSQRYLAGYISAGPISQEASAGQYDLGPFALHLGPALPSRQIHIAARAFSYWP